MRVALLGAFPFPAPQGSQLCATEQARALAAAGCEIVLFCYGRGDGRRLPGLSVARAPAWLSPGRLRAGPSPAKPAADLALLGRFLAAHRRRAFDAVLGHNAEAALVGLAARPWARIPVVYVAHTLWQAELGAYGPRALERLAAGLGRSVDAIAARGADAVIALSRRAARALAAWARGPVAWIPPGLARSAPPTPAEVGAACARAALAPEAYVVYAGNLDGYQNLELLDRAAARLPDVATVVVTHDARGPRLPNLRRVLAANPDEARALVHGARVAVLPRRRVGGFPMKLLHYMEAGRAVVAFAGVAETLEHDRSAWLLPPKAGAEAWARAIRACFDDAALRERLGEGARRALALRHAWPTLATRTLEILEQARRGAASG